MAATISNGPKRTTLSAAAGQVFTPSTSVRRCSLANEGAGSVLIYLAGTEGGAPTGSDYWTLASGDKLHDVAIADFGSLFLYSSAGAVVTTFGLGS
jgi:streptogramin lyase